MERILPKVTLSDPHARRFMERLMAKKYDLEEIMDRIDRKGMSSLTKDEASYAIAIYKFLNVIFE